MRPWVQSEYAEELAVLFAVLTSLLPWTVEYSDLGETGTLLFVRFPLFQVQYLFGSPLGSGTTVQDPYSATALQAEADFLSGADFLAVLTDLGGTSLATAYAVWVIGACIVVAALALAAAMYVEVDALDRVRPVALMGVLLIAAAVAFAAATVLLYDRGFPGLKVPVGVAFQFVFGVILLWSRRT